MIRFILIQQHAGNITKMNFTDKTIIEKPRETKTLWNKTAKK